METIGDRIRARRRQMGLTLDQVSIDTQVPKSTIQRWESGAIKNMGQAGLQKVAASLNTTVEWLMTGKNPEGSRRSMTENEFLFWCLCDRNHFELSEDKTKISRKIGNAEYSIPIEEQTVQELLKDAVDYFGYILMRQAKKHNEDGEIDLEELIEVFHR